MNINKKHIILREGVPYKSTLLVEQYDYYKYQIMPEPDLETIYIYVTPITGDPELFASRFQPKPGFEGFEKVACFCVNLMNYTKVEIDQNPQYTALYISVFGLSTTTYTINVIIERKDDENNKKKEIILYDGIPQKSVFE